VTGLAARVGAALGVEVRELVPVAGGDLNDAFRAELAGGGRAFVKTSSGAPAGGYAAEAAGLRWLAAASGGPRLPEVLAVDPGFLALEWMEPGAGGADGPAEESLGRELAALHRAEAEAHGIAPPGTAPAPGAAPGSAPPVRLGPLLLPGTPAATWGEVHAANRLLPLARMASDRGALDAPGVLAVEAVAARMDVLAGPHEPPARLHGDLWAGNVLWTAGGGGALVDPAAHGGHREVDLAMLRLFGGPGPRLHAAYAEAFPLADGHAERVELWQLTPLLVHAVLFGGSYGPRAAMAARRYA
jgi:fructosamine-3-kinase